MRRILRIESIPLLVVLVLAACSTAPPRQTTLMKKSHMTISAAELRVQVRSLAGRFSGLMENAGESILRSDANPVLRRRALLWLTNGIPAMQQALFQPDPLAALIDAWFLAAQMREYFENLERHGVHAKYADLVNTLLDEMEADIKLIVENSGPDVDYNAAKELIHGKARESEIDVTFVSRLGTAAFLAEFTSASGGSAFQAIGSITETASDLVARIDLNAEYIPKFVRWHAELLIMDEIKGDPDYDTVVSAVSKLEYLEVVGAMVEDVRPLLDDLPDLVANERMAVLEALDAYLKETLRFVEMQRSTLMTEEVRYEREAIMAAVREERIAVLEAVSEERRIILETLGRERSAIFQDLDVLMDRAFTREINRLFLRGLLLIAILLIGFSAITILGVRALKRRDS